MAIIGVLLLPCDYRAGAAFSHPHSLLQLWIDAADGSIAHHHADEREAAPEMSLQGVDLAPDSTPSLPHRVGDPHPDVGEQQQSAPAVSGLHLLNAAIALLLDLVVRQ